MTVARHLGDAALGLEARAARDDHLSLRLWLRLLSLATQIETQIRQRLRQQHGTTLARFDYMAQLHRHPQGLRMAALSRYLMVTGGNVTGLTNQLAAEGLVQRQAEAGDKRATLVCLTSRGRRLFEGMAAEHEAWVVALLAGLPRGEQAQLHALLGRARIGLAQQLQAQQALEDEA